jgi:predicted SAM-dependent methyltransferase
LAEHFGITVQTVDHDPKLNPNYVASITELPFSNYSYDCVCAFQVLEHLPYEQSLQALSEMTRISKNYIIISLPDAKRVLNFSLQIQGRGQRFLHIPIPLILQHENKFDGQHYWEIHKQNYTLKKVINDFCKMKINLRKTYRISEHPFHRFFIYQKI